MNRFGFKMWVIFHPLLCYILTQGLHVNADLDNPVTFTIPSEPLVQYTIVDSVVTQPEAKTYCTQHQDLEGLAVLRSDLMMDEVNTELVALGFSSHREFWIGGMTSVHQNIYVDLDKNTVVESSLPGYILTKDSGCPKNDIIGKRKVKTVEKCADICEKNEGCVGFMVNLRHKPINCWVKNICENITTLNNVDTYLKADWCLAISNFDHPELSHRDFNIYSRDCIAESRRFICMTRGSSENNTSFTRSLFTVENTSPTVTYKPEYTMEVNNTMVITVVVICVCVIILIALLLAFIFWRRKHKRANFQTGGQPVLLSGDASKIKDDDADYLVVTPSNNSVYYNIPNNQKTNNKPCAEDEMIKNNNVVRNISNEEVYTDIEENQYENCNTSSPVYSNVDQQLAYPNKASGFQNPRSKLKPAESEDPDVYEALGGRNNEDNQYQALFSKTC